MKILKRKKQFLIIFISVSALFFIIFTAVYIYNKKIQDSMRILSDSKISVRNTGCIIKTFGRNSDSVSAKISFYTPGGRLISSYERSWKGWELDLECIVLKMNDSVLVFPYRVFSDKTKYGTGICLFRYYSSDSFPEIYDYLRISEKEKVAIRNLFKTLSFSPYVFKLFSGAKSMTINLREFKPDNEYVLLVNSKKSVYLKKN